MQRVQEHVYARNTHRVCKLPATQHKKGVATREQLIKAAVSGAGWLKALNWQCWFVGGAEINRMLQLLDAADEVGLLRGSRGQGSNDGTKVKTILCGSHDI